jgi:hypothetical protein
MARSFRGVTMKKKKRLSIGDKVWIVIEKRDTNPKICPTCHKPVLDSSKDRYIVQSIVVSTLSSYGMGYIRVNDKYLDLDGGFYYTRKEARKVVKSRNEALKRQRDNIKKNKKEEEKMLNQRSNNPVKGLPITLYKIHG